jgi:hypothetical protein
MATRPITAGCAKLFAVALRFSAAQINEAEGVDRLNSAQVVAGARRVATAAEELRHLSKTCGGGTVLPLPRRVPELEAPRTLEAFPAAMRAEVPRGTTRADVVINGQRFPHSGVVIRGTAGSVLSGPYGRWNVGFQFFSGARLIGSAESRSVWLLPRTARAHHPATYTDKVLVAKLASLAATFNGNVGIWVHDLRTGASAGWNEDARFPAASTVKLAVLIASLDKFGPRPERSPVAYDLAALAGWSSNLAANRLLRELGGSSERGSQIAEATLRRLGATSSSYTGDYRVGTRVRAAGSDRGAPDPPPLVSQRVTTAHDLGRILYLLQAAAMDSRSAQAVTRLSQHEARVGLDLLLSSEPKGDNLGLFRPSLATVPMAQKNGWLNDARHTAAIIYPDHGPFIVVLLTYRIGLTRPESAALGARLLGLVQTLR